MRLGPECGDPARPLTRVGTHFTTASNETTLASARALGDREHEGRLLNNLGGVYANLGEPGKRLEYLRAALDLRRGQGDEFGVAATLNNLGSLHRSLGEVDEAVLHLTEALASSRGSTTATGWRAPSTTSVTLPRRGRAGAGSCLAPAGDPDSPRGGGSGTYRESQAPCLRVALRGGYISPRRQDIRLHGAAPWGGPGSPPCGRCGREANGVV